MLLLYPREILILDLELSQTVGVVAIERSGVPFAQVGKVAAQLGGRLGPRLCPLESSHLETNLPVVLIIFKVKMLAGSSCL